jgi:tetratricopeptide (TPR) repeat protein
VRGTAFVNRALAGLFEEVRRAFPLPAKVCQIESDKIVVAAQIDKKTDYQQLIKSVIEGASQKMSNLTEFTAGVFTTGSKLDGIKGDKSVLDPQKALNYARYANVALADGEKQIELFTPRTALAIIAKHRNQKTQAEALVDYQAFHDLGVEYSNIENQVALCAFELGKLDFAIAHVQRAVELQPSEPVLKANLAYLYMAFKQPQQAHESFTRLHAEHPDYKLDDVYIGPEALAAYAVFKKDSKALSCAAVTKMLENAFQIASPGRADNQNRVALALADVKVHAEREGLSQTETASKLLPDITLIWTSLVEAVGRVSPFTRTYLVDAHPVSFQNGVFTIGFAPEFQDQLMLVDNARNHQLIMTKLRELGHTVDSVKFIKN